MADGYVDVLVLVLIDKHCFAPLLSRFALYCHCLALHSQLISQPLFYLVLMHSVDIEEGLCAANGGYVQDNTQVTGITTLVLMQDSVAIDEHDLRPEMRLVGFEPPEQLQCRRQLSESQETRDVLFIEHDIQIILINDLLLLDTVNDQTCTGSIFVPSRKTDIHSSSQLQLLRLPIEGVRHDDLAPHEGLLFDPSFPLFFGHLCPFLVVVCLHYIDLTKYYLSVAITEALWICHQFGIQLWGGLVYNSLSIIFLFSPIKMSLDPSLLKTPPRLRKPIECVSYRQKDQKGRKKQQESDIPFSFRGIEKDEILKGYLSQLDQYQQAHGRSREEHTEKKLKLVSAMAFQKTEKKKYLKLISSHPRHQAKSQQSYEDFESMIADEQYDGADKGKTQQVRASLDYFAQELGLMNEEIRKSGINLQIENQVRIVMLSQKNSECNLPIEQSQAIRRRSYELSPTQKIRRKIMLSGQQAQEQRKETSSEVYRYCIGCQFPIIQTSITKHEQECQKFQQVYDMNYQQIADFLKSMIGELSKRIEHIQQSLTFDDLKNLKICTDGLLRESQLISLSGQPNPAFDLKYQSLYQINQKWLSFAQQICKLNWFIKLRQSVKRSQGK